MTDTIYTIRDIDGSNPRQVTLAQYKAEVAQAVARARAIHAANVAAVKASRH